jgi:hypothetical protein
MRLYEDLHRAERSPGRVHMLQPLRADRELFGLVTIASSKKRRAGQNWRTFFAELDPRWERPELWERLAKLITVPAEFMDVIYVYRNLTNGLPIAYREVLLDDLRTRFGPLSLQQYLEPGLLRDIFGGGRLNPSNAVPGPAMANAEVHGGGDSQSGPL